MSERIHDDEVDTSATVVHSLLAQQLPELAGRSLTYLRNSGTVNAMWRVNCADGRDAVVRLPRTADFARGVDKEARLLPSLAESALIDLVAIPTLRHLGEPTDAFPLRWLVLDWLAGDDAWTRRDDLAMRELADQLAEIVGAIGELTTIDAPDRRAGQRGGPLLPMLDRLDRWLSDPQWNAESLVDVQAVRRCADVCREAADEPVDRRFVHGDLIPGNLLVTKGTLSAVIDWGGCGYGDWAQDLGPAWSVLDRAGGQRFRAALKPDPSTWLRAKAFELEQAVGGVLYYTPRDHPLADVMGWTLDRVLNDSE